MVRGLAYRGGERRVGFGRGGRRDYLQESARHPRILRESSSHGSVVSQRLVLYRGFGLFRRGGIPLSKRTKKGHDQERRSQHLSLGDRERALQPPECAGSRSDWSSRFRLGRGREGRRG